MTLRPLARLREVREARGLTQAELARKTGFRTGTVALFEAGTYYPSPRDAANLANALGVAPEELSARAKPSADRP